MGEDIADLAPIARHHGVAPGDMVPVPRQGVANRTFLLGRDLVLRVARMGFTADLRKESQIIPVACEFGIRTPPIVEYDDSRRLVSAAFMVLRRCHGTEPAIPETAVGDSWRGYTGS